MFISCSTSPSAITLVASDSTCMTRMLFTSTIIWNAREYKKIAHQYAGGVAEALRWRSVGLCAGVDSSTTSSWSKVAVWMNSTTAASVKRSGCVVAQCAAEQEQ